MKFIQARHYYSGGNQPRLIVIHDMEYPERPTGAEWCAEYFAGPNAPAASAHFCVDNDSVVQCVHESDGAWHTPGRLPDKLGVEINRSSIGIEHAGYAKQTAEEWADEYSQAMLKQSAALVADICLRHDIPPVLLTAQDLKLEGIRGICGHDDCTKATGVGSHWDPGPHFPWAWFMVLVRSEYDARCQPLIEEEI
jgi:N-acetyl-anhydromuramyl-L-alanine amidase AmpD